jgi:hypothetical protein
LKILFDVNTPAPLAWALRKHEITRAGQLGWQSLQNGKLLRAADAAGFEILITCDQNMRYQQNLTNYAITLIVLSTNHWPTIQKVSARIASAVEFVQPGQILCLDLDQL